MRLKMWEGQIIEKYAKSRGEIRIDPDFSFFTLKSLEFAEAGRGEFEKHWLTALPFKS